jgi:hypothetical protein
LINTSKITDGATSSTIVNAPRDNCLFVLCRNG